ncbi:hypothetical protein F5884DRAFT_314392 [Xylogone sp. PMI_703]|nr:hypothetical protein F5884DRAFT_314392 [Xylogone sp. PMI_703]
MAAIHGEYEASSAYTSTASAEAAELMNNIAHNLLQEPIDFRYAGIDDLLTKVNSTENDSFTITGVSPYEYNKIVRKRVPDTERYRVSLYIEQARLMIITIPTAAHEEIHKGLDDIIHREAIIMGLFSECKAVGSTRYQRTVGANQFTRGEGDSARKPASLRPRPTDFPTIVIEAGYTQSLPSLRQKARWWFATSSHDVKVVILAKVDTTRDEMIIEQWREVVVPRSGATMTRASAAAGNLTPQATQVVTITRNNGIGRNHPNVFQPASYTVHNAPPTINFQDIFLRNPVGGQGNFIITAADLQTYTSGLWRTMLT